ncbi:hypothetical protein BJX62DRAFT_238517 [Aspergillus germanicus]
MSHPQTACSTSSNNLCAQCLPLYTPMHGHIPAEQLNCPSLTTYPYILRIRVHPAMTAAEGQLIQTISQQLANVIAPRVQNMFGGGAAAAAAAGNNAPIPIIGTQKFRPEYTDLSFLIDLPSRVDLSGGDVVATLGIAAFIPCLGYGQESWSWDSPEADECAQWFRLTFFEENFAESQRVYRLLMEEQQRERERERERQMQQQQQPQLDTTKSYITYSSPFVGGSIGSEEAQERRMARAKMPWWAKTRARTAEREVLMLVDFLEEVKEGDEVFKLFLDGFGKRVEVVEVKFPGPDTTWNAHRQAWWVYTHPAQNGDPGFSATTLNEQAVRRKKRRRRSRRQSESQPQQTYTQKQPQQPQQLQWQWQPQQPQQVTPISVDPNYPTAPAVETERIPTAREARRMQIKTPRWMKNIKFKP